MHTLLLFRVLWLPYAKHSLHVCICELYAYTSALICLTLSVYVCKHTSFCANMWYVCVGGDIKEVDNVGICPGVCFQERKKTSLTGTVARATLLSWKSVYKSQRKAVTGKNNGNHFTTIPLATLNHLPVKDLPVIPSLPLTSPCLYVPEVPPSVPLVFIHFLLQLTCM